MFGRILLSILFPPRERKKALKEAAENPLAAPPDGVSAKERVHMTFSVCKKVLL